MVKTSVRIGGNILKDTYTSLLFSIYCLGLFCRDFYCSVALLDGVSHAMTGNSEKNLVKCIAFTWKYCDLNYLTWKASCLVTIFICMNFLADQTTTESCRMMGTLECNTQTIFSLIIINFNEKQGKF